MASPEIYSSIVVYKNPPDILSRCIESIIHSTVKVKLFIVDNSPSDVYKNLCEKYGLEYVCSPKNIGYGSAHNIVIRKSVEHNIPYHLVINPDVYFEPQVLIGLREFMDIHQDVGLVMPKIMYPDGNLQRLCKLLPSPGQLFARRFLPFLATKLDYAYQLEFADYNTCFECPSLSGCFMFLRTGVLQQVGLFDERFFMYFEDVDLVRRIGQHFRTVYWPDVAITHHYEKGSYSSKKLLIYHLTSAVKYFNKWGWFRDVQRKAMNRRTLARLESRRMSRFPLKED
jgi:GT2 family glycosyltransferase